MKIEDKLNDWHTLCKIVGQIEDDTIALEKLELIEEYNQKVRDYFIKYQTPFNSGVKP